MTLQRKNFDCHSQYDNMPKYLVLTNDNPQETSFVVSQYGMHFT
jgi:hypothetical protein